MPHGKKYDDASKRYDKEALHSVAEAIDLVRSKQQPDGTWLLENTHPGKVHFELEEGDGQPSKWNTLRALRVLNWYEHP